MVKMKLKSLLSGTLASIMLLSIMGMFPATFASPGSTYLKMINDDSLSPDYGTTLFNYTLATMPTETGYPLGYLLANVTVFDVSELAAWQINVTWDSDLLEIAKSADMIIPSDNVFDGYPDPVGLTIVPGSVYWMVGIKYGAPFTNVTIPTQGTLCQIKFNVTKLPTSTISCTIHFVITDTLVTKLLNPLAGLIAFTPEDGEYYFTYVVPPLPKPYFEVYPSLVEMGKPLGPSIINTTKAEFSIDILIDNLVNESMLTGLQFALNYPTDLFRLVPGIPYNATEGPFMAQPSWAPFGTDFFTAYGGIDSGIETQYVVLVLNPNNVTHAYDWGVFPDTTGLSPSERVICTFDFEAIVQEEYPWDALVTGAFDIDYMFPSLPEHMFLSAEYEWIPGQPPVDGDYYIQGWILGLMLDVYTQYPDPYGGQGLNETSDMFEPQATVMLRAELTYNADPVQNKPVVFQVVGGGGTCEDPGNTTGFVNFTRIAMTDDEGVAYITFGIPWPCSPEECEEIFGVWQVVASATVREQIAKDWLWFKVGWLVMDLTITPKGTMEFKKGEEANFTVTFCTWALVPRDVLLVVTLYDDLSVPIGTVAIWVTVGDPEIEWCTSECYEFTFLIPLPKWAFAGEGTAFANAMTDWPFDCGVPVCPEASTTFTLLKYT